MDAVTPKDDANPSHDAFDLPRVRTRIEGLDEILHGGIPAGATTLVWGGAGCGKSILGVEFLYRGALAGEPGIFVVFEESAQAVRRQALTLGWDLAALEDKGKLFLLEGTIDPAMILAGDFDLRGLLAIIGGQAEALGAKHIVLDAVDVLTRLYRDPLREQSEIYSLRRWLIEREMTTILTMKVLHYHIPLPGYEFLDFMADCVIKLDQRISNQVNTRRLQVLKYRGSSFGRNEYPYIIAADGIHLLPVSFVAFTKQSLGDVVSSGNGDLDKILGGGYRHGSSLLMSGMPGTGKTTIASTFVQAACARGEQTLFLAFEESEEAVIANMMSAGIDLRPAREAGILQFISTMPESTGAEEHLFEALHTIRRLQARLVVVDALSSVLRMGSEQAAFEYAMRLLFFCREHGITCLCTNQAVSAEHESSFAGVGVSSFVDSIIQLRFAEADGMLHRTLLVPKMRGAAPSNRCHELSITDHGIEIIGVYGRNGRSGTPARA
jgi:circadian clock protein KaiC